MKKIYFTMLFAFFALSLSAQSITLTTVQDSSAQQAMDIYDFDTEHKNQNIIQENDGFFFYMYDYRCQYVDTYDEKYWVKIFMGTTYDDVLNSANTILNWYVKANDGEYITTTNPDGQQIFMQKVSPTGLNVLMITYGTADDIQWACMQTKIYHSGIASTLFSFVPSTIGSSEAAIYTNLQNRIAENKFHPTSETSKGWLKQTIKRFKKRYRNKK